MAQPAFDDAEEGGLGRKELRRIVGRFEALGQERLRRIRASLTHEQRSFFDLLPMLWHVNHPMMPGFVSTETPAGVIAFRPSREQLLLARRYARGYKEEKRPHRSFPIRGLYLMGSMGSLGQTLGSDMDFWLCHAEDLDDRDLNRLRTKAARLEEFGESIGLHVHFFLMHDASFRAGEVEALSKESSGHTQHTLLLEEFYRTGILLAGNPLLWWVVPPAHDADYTDYTGQLVEKRFIRPLHWLDFGGLHDLPAEEFFGVAHWQLFKGIDAPYKSLLKLMLLEAYASEYPAIDWLCMETKRAVFSDRDLDPDTIDPYLLILARITRYLDSRNEADRLQLARRAFYFKAGQVLARPNPGNDWRHTLMRRECDSWGWSQAELALLDTRPAWKLERVVGERDALVSELSRSYRLLTEFAREQDAVASLNTRELALLGRKLYAALDKRPGKIDRVNPGISRDLSERTLWLKRSPDRPPRWQLHLHDPEEPPHTPAKTSTSLVEILAWLHLNGICERSTQIHHIPKADNYGEIEQDRILKSLRKRLSRKQSGDGTLEAYADNARGRLSTWFVNVADNPLAAHAAGGYHLISARDDALSYGAAHECLVTNIEHLFTTTWGEVRVERHGDGERGLLDCLVRYLDLFAPHAHDVGPVSAHSYSSSRGNAIARRVAQLAQSVAHAFRTLGLSCRYLVRIGDQYFEILHDGERYQWSPIGERADLDDHLAESGSHFTPIRIDPRSLPDSPLPALLQRNQPDRIQLFYRVRERGIELYCFDEQGAVFQHWAAGADEYHLVVQMQRFLDGFASRRMLASGDGTPAEPPHFARVMAQAGEWLVTQITAPRSSVTDHTELLLAINPGGRLHDGFRLQMGRREFDSLTLGERLYTEVARHLRPLRAAGDRAYPVHVTGVIGADGDAGGHPSLIELLRLKYRVEERLAAALRSTPE
jgi:adenylate cyclase class 1